LDSRLPDFLNEIGGGLGDSRRVARATEYVAALLEDSSEPKSFAQLARLLSTDERDRYKREQSFQHLVNDGRWDPDELLRPAAERIAEEIEVRAMMLLAVVFPHLGEHLPQYPDRRHRRQQIASVLQLVGRDRRSGEPVILPIRWRLSLEDSDWRSRERRERAEVDYAVGVHISVHGNRHVAAVGDWKLGGAVPLVAGPSYGWSRTHWLRARSRVGRVRYLVELPELAVWDSDEQLEMLLSTRPDEPTIRARTTLPEGLSWGPGQWCLYDLRGELGVEHVLVAWPDEGDAKSTPRAWCTNLPAASVEEQQRLVELALLRGRTDAFWDELRYGLLGAASYRGFSVKGWERHCALITAAQAYRIHAGIGEPRKPDLPEGRSQTKWDWRTGIREIADHEA